jgi:hypothetical protein
VIRRPDWQQRLDAFLRDHQFEPFHYGRWDCGLFVCSAIAVMTGVDPAASLRSVYSSPREAIQTLRARGLRSVEALVESVTTEYRMPETPVTCAQRGDVALVRHSLGLVAMNGREVLLASQKGLWRVPLSMASRAWRV